MKKKVIASLLSVVLTVSGIGPFPVSALEKPAETAAQEVISTQEDSIDQQEAEEAVSEETEESETDIPDTGETSNSEGEEFEQESYLATEEDEMTDEQSASANEPVAGSEIIDEPQNTDFDDIGDPSADNEAIYETFAIEEEIETAESNEAMQGTCSWDIYNDTLAISGRTFSGMKKGNTYYVQVRTYMLEYGVRYYSGYCTTKTITIKK